MLQLIISFLISLGFQLPSDNADTVIINEQNGAEYGIVITDDVGTKSYLTITYDQASGVFKVVQ